MNISRISNFTDDALTQYAHDISEEKNMSMTLVYNALDALRKFNVFKKKKRVFLQHGILWFVIEGLFCKNNQNISLFC